MACQNDHKVSLNRKNDKAAFLYQRSQMEEVICRYQTDLLRYAAAMLNNPDLAQQVVQEVFIKLFSKWETLERTDNRLRVWLFRVTHNEAVDLIRSEERRKNREASYTEDYCSERLYAKPEDKRNERMKEVLRYVRSLPEPNQRVILLRLQQGMGYEEISEVTGYAAGTCRNLLSQAVRQLADMVERAGGSHD